MVLVAILLSSCASTPSVQNNETVNQIQQAEAAHNARVSAIEAMPDTPERYVLLKRENDAWGQYLDGMQKIFDHAEQSLHTWSEIDANDAAADALRAQALTSAQPQPTPYVAPTPIQVQIVPNPYGGY